jgi:hypothetical protein
MNMSEETLTASDIETLRELNDWIDDPPVTDYSNCPEVERLLAAAWYATEDAIRINTGKCSSQHTSKDEHAPETGPTFTCSCCRYFNRIGPGARALIRHAH